MELSGNILEHWPHLSGNAAKLLVWLVASGTKQGCVEAKNFEDIARANGWTSKVLRGAIKELEAKLHITVERATGRHALTRIQITPSLLGSSGISTPSQTGSSSVPDVPSEPSLAVPQEIPPKYSAGELSAAARQVMAYIGFSCDQKYLSRGFVVLLEKFGKLRPWPRPGMLASKLIERALHWQRKRRAEGKDRLLYAWPAGFQKYVSNLRRHERLAGKAERARAAAA